MNLLEEECRRGRVGLLSLALAYLSHPFRDQVAGQVEPNSEAEVRGWLEARLGKK